MNQVVNIPQNFGAVSTKFQNAKVENDLASGVQAGFGLIGYKGKVWSIRYRGDEQKLLRDDGDGPRNSIEVVILKGSTHISKIWYEDGYVEGSDKAPDCFSPNGVVPDPQSAKRQSDACASCPRNVWGSRITAEGRKGKDCSDSKRLAVVPLGDILNEAYGGPMLLRVPAASLQDLATFGNKMQQLGYPYYAIATRISFDANEAYPKFVFGAIRPLTDEEADKVIMLQSGEEVKRVISEEAPPAQPNANQAAVANAFEQPPQQTTAPKPEPKSEPKPELAKEPIKEVTPQGKASGFGPTTATKSEPAQQEPAKTEAKTEPAKTELRAPPVIPDDDDETAPDDNVSEIELSLDEQLAKLLPDG